MEPLVQGLLTRSGVKTYIKMKNLIRSLFGASSQATPVRSAPTASRDNPATIQEGSENAIRRQLVQVLLRDVLRKHGIPPHWIDLQMLVVSSSRRGTGMYVRLVMKQWDDRLMNYALALQNTLFADIVRFEPQASDWLQGISWQLDMADTCPYLTLPDKAFWLDPVKQAIPVAPVDQATPVTQPVQATEENAAQQDLERLFFIRDQEISRAAGSHAPVDYEKTQPSPL
jgi:hypothetical protein